MEGTSASFRTPPNGTSKRERIESQKGRMGRFLIVPNGSASADQKYYSQRHLLDFQKFKLFQSRIQLWVIMLLGKHCTYIVEAHINHIKLSHTWDSNLGLLVCRARFYHYTMMPCLLKGTVF